MQAVSAVRTPGPTPVRSTLEGELFVPGTEALTVQHVGTAPWAGIGVCAAKLSPALPVDVLGLLCGLERARRALAAPKSWALIADSNAVAVGFAPDAVAAAASRAASQLRAASAHLGFPIEFVRGSAVERDAGPHRLGQLPPYETRQLIQMRQMARRGLRVKVGWRLSSAARDEAHFDQLYATHVRDAPIVTIYTIGGRTFDSRRPRACPYVVANPDARLLLERGVRIQERLALERNRDERAARGYTKLVRKIGRELARLAGHRPHRCPEVHVQSVLDAL